MNRFSRWTIEVRKRKYLWSSDDDFVYFSHYPISYNIIHTYFHHSPSCIARPTDRSWCCCHWRCGITVVFFCGFSLSLSFGHQFLYLSKKKRQYFSRVLCPQEKGKKEKRASVQSDREERERDTARRLSGVVGVCVMKEKTAVPRTQLNLLNFLPYHLRVVLPDFLLTMFFVIEVAIMLIGIPMKSTEISTTPTGKSYDSNLYFALGTTILGLLLDFCWRWRLSLLFQAWSSGGEGDGGWWWGITLNLKNIRTCHTLCRWNIMRRPTHRWRRLVVVANASSWRGWSAF